MKRVYVAFSAAIIASFAAVALVNAQAAKPEKGVLVGTVVELGTYAMQGVGEEHVAAHKARIEEGFPVGVVTDEGDVWVCVFRDNAPASHLEPANKHMAEYAGKKCAIQGLKYAAKGVNVIRVSVLSEY